MKKFKITKKVQNNKKGQWKKKVRMKKEFYGARGIGVEVWENRRKIYFDYKKQK